MTINQLITPELPAIQADRDKTKQVLLNLLNNAIKYNRRNGEITLLAASDGTEMVITIRDTGIGIPSAAIPHLFEKFFRVIGSEKIAFGTGLGLSFCWQIVQAQRGHIEVNSQVDKGTEFIIHLPLRQG